MDGRCLNRMIIEQGVNYYVHCDICFEFIDHFEARINTIKGFTVNIMYKNFCKDCIKKTQGKSNKELLKNLMGI